MFKDDANRRGRGRAGTRDGELSAAPTGSEGSGGTPPEPEGYLVLEHELRRPLAPIRTAVETLRLCTPGNRPAQRAVAIITRQLGLMERLLDELLAGIRAPGSEPERGWEPVPIDRPIWDALELVRPQIDAAAHRVELALPDPCLRVTGDADRLVQIFANLLENAAKFTAPGGTIAVRAERDGDWVLVSINDTGEGIRAEDLSRIFEPFAKAGADRAARPGFGLGLGIARRLTELHGGTIRAQSAGPGQGTKFLVRLLAAEAPPADAGPVPGAVSEDLPGPGDIRVLLVEDDPDTAESAALLIDALGHAVDVANGPDQALALARERPYQLVLLDISLGSSDGFSVARALRRMHWGADAYIVAVTGLRDPGTRTRAEAAGIDRVVLKPIGLDAFVEVLRTAAGRRRPGSGAPG
jgi:CheY-like chemotaxis protein/anti-sigma regulatory factor (Ser/Thr protein kinase)